MAELLITSSIDPIEEGQLFEHGLPRHVTIWQDFTLPDVHLDDFTKSADDIIKGFSPLEFLGLDNAEYRPNNDVPVRRVLAVGRGATAATLHSLLGIAIMRYDGELRHPEWAYENLNLHVTYVDGQAVEEGEYFALNTIELIQRDPEHRKHKIVKKLWDLTEEEWA